MAYGIKYSLQFRDRKDFRWQVYIYKKDYAGATFGLQCLGDPLTFEMRASGDVFDPIKIQEATLNVVVSGAMMGGDTDETVLQEFKTANIFDFFILVTKETAVGSGVSATYYSGGYITDTYTEPYDQLPYNLSLRFSDLGDLDFIEFEDATSFYKGIDTFSEIIYNCLKSLPYTYDIKEILNIFPNEIVEVDSTSVLANIKSNVTGYVAYDFVKKIPVGNSCLSVLRKILGSFGARMFQYDSFWWIVRLNEMIDSADGAVKYLTLTYASQYATVGTNGTVTFNQAIDNTEANGIAMSSGAELSIEPLVDILTYKYRNQEPVRNGNNIIFNSQFDKGFYVVNSTNTAPLFWRLHSSLISGLEHIAASNTDKITKYTTSGSTVEISSQAFAFLPQAISSARTEAQGGDVGQTIKSQDKYYINAHNPITDGNTDYAQEYVQLITADKMRLRIKGKYIMRRDYYGTGATFLNLVQKFVLEIKENATSRIWRLDGDNATWKYQFYSSYGPKFTTQLKTSGAVSDLHTNDFDFELEIPSMPFNGIADYIDFKLFVPQSNIFSVSHRIETAIYESVSLEYISNDQTADEVIVTENNLVLSDQKNVERIYESFHGDGPFKYSLGALYYETGGAPALTSTWHQRDDATDIAFSQHFINTFFAIYADYLRKLTIDIYGHLNLSKRMLLNDAFIYLLDGFSHSVKNSIFSTQLIEITEKVGLTVNQNSYTGIKSLPETSAKANIPKIKAKPNGVISGGVLHGFILGTKVFGTATETAGDYPG